MASAPANVDIINVRADKRISDGENSIRDQIVAGLSKPQGEKSLPTMLLYDERGLRLYDDITTKVPEYYLFPAEEEILKNHADEIVRVMHAADDGKVKADEVVVELGAGWVTFQSPWFPFLQALPPTLLIHRGSYYVRRSSISSIWLSGSVTAP